MKTGFPFMAPLYICLYCFNISATAFSPNFLISAFANIYVNMTFVSTFINESILCFDYLSLINNEFIDLYILLSNIFTKLSMPPRRSLLLVYFQRP